jgi:hypothetical protein
MATASADLKKLKRQVQQLDKLTKKLKVALREDYEWERDKLRPAVNRLLRKVRPKGPPNVTPPPPPPK